MGKKPTRAQIIEHLRREIYVWRKSYTNLVGPAKGKVTDDTALRAIACLSEALRIIK